MANIVIADDALFMRKVLGSILAKDGHEIVGEAKNAKEAVALFKKLKPDLLTLDIIMLKVGGMDAKGALREILRFDKKAKVIMVSSLGQKDLVDEFIRAGAKDFIVKPFEPSQVLAAIKRVLES